MDSPDNQHQPLTVPALGYEFLRSELIPDLLGNDTNEILYWAGRKLASRHPVKSIEELPSLFSDLAFGTLILQKQNKNEATYELASELIQKRIEFYNNVSFALEAGFLAQQFQEHKQCITECHYDFNKGKIPKVLLQLKWDSKDTVTK